jgi:hypothetical protein
MRHARCSAKRIDAIVFIGSLAGWLEHPRRGRSAGLLLGGLNRKGVPSAGCTTNGAASCSERHRSVDGDLMLVVWVGTERLGRIRALVC